MTWVNISQFAISCLYPEKKLMPQNDPRSSSSSHREGDLLQCLLLQRSLGRGGKKEALGGEFFCLCEEEAKISCRGDSGIKVSKAWWRKTPLDLQLRGSQENNSKWISRPFTKENLQKSICIVCEHRECKSPAGELMPVRFGVFVS